MYTGLGPSSMVSATTFGPSSTVYMGSPEGSLGCSWRGGRAACRLNSGCRAGREVVGRASPGWDGAPARVLDGGLARALVRPAAPSAAGRSCVPALCARASYSAVIAAAVLDSSTAPPAASSTRRDIGGPPAPRRSPSPRICVSRPIPDLYRLSLTLTGCELFCTRRTERIPAAGSSANEGRRPL